MSKIIQSKKQIAIVGPTASGKSALGIFLAKKFQGEIISSDSRQIYRNLDIGSGKEPGKLEIIQYQTNGKFKILVKKENLNLKNFKEKILKKQKKNIQSKIYQTYICENIPHYMIDILHPNTIYSAGKFVKKAKKIQQEIWQRKNLPIICGGTMFWAQALIEEQQFPTVPPNLILRKKLKKKNQAEILAILKKIDPRRTKEILRKNEQNNIPRLIRAIEIANVLGKTPSINDFVNQKNNSNHSINLQKNKNNSKKNKKVSSINSIKNLIIAVSPPKEILHQKIEKRMDNWFNTGIFDEIYSLHYDLKVPWKRLESFGLEYKWCTRYVRGQIDFNEMRENTIRDLKKYAKRQITWLRRWERSGTKIHSLTSYSKAEKLVKNFIQFN
jgi:tRNA dimethylallyltransferase